MDILHYETEDGKTLEGHFYDANSDRFALLMHMMPATKESYAELAAELQKRGISSLAFDQRGHGKSSGGPNGFKEFTDFEQQEKMIDVTASIEELKMRGAKEENIILVGASIGANLAMVTLTQQPNLRAAVALSPGLDYRGVNTERIVKDFHDGQKVLLVASDEDEYSMLSLMRLHGTNDKHMEAVKETDLGHGTTMLEDKALFDRVANWIDAHV